MDQNILDRLNSEAKKLRDKYNNPRITFTIKTPYNKKPYIELDTEDLISWLQTCLVPNKIYIGGDDKIKFKRDGKTFTRAVTKCVKIDGKYVPINKL